jgi:four helix bundle protein
MVEKFEDLLVWQEARKLTNDIAGIVKRPTFGKGFSLVDQILRSSRSIMSNIAEGFGRYTYRDYKQFLFIARGSLTETQSHLYIALDLRYITEEEFQKIYDLTVSVYKLLNGLISYLKKAQN